MTGNEEKERTKEALASRLLNLFVVRSGGWRCGRRTTCILLGVLLECEQLLRTERFVVDVRSRLDKVLQVCPVRFQNSAKAIPEQKKK